MLHQYYFHILYLHIGCVILSGALFFSRGVMRLFDMTLANHRILKIASYWIDTTLLIAAILLTIIIQQYPLIHSWLTVKLVFLFAYIALGSLALKRAQSRRARFLAFISAIASYGFIASIAVTHDPLGIFRLVANP